jgi:hypothetical protein
MSPDRGFARFLLVTLLAMITICGAAEARERGKPDSAERALYCKHKWLDCLEQGFKQCDKDNANDIEANGLCRQGVVGTCNATWGAESDCTSAERPRPLEQTDVPAQPSVSPGGSKPKKAPKDGPVVDPPR